MRRATPRTFFAVSLAGSLFFNVSVGAARPRVIAYLLVTLAPFLVLAPLVGPLIDRFARSQRVVAATTCLGRGILCLFVAGDIKNLLLYPEVFGILVLDKAYRSPRVHWCRRSSPTAAISWPRTRASRASPPCRAS